jgi:hypothetical protein
VADWALMEGLAARVALLLHPHVTPATALPLLEGALRAGPGAERLAVACTRCIARHLHHLVDDPLLSQLVSAPAGPYPPNSPCLSSSFPVCPALPPSLPPQWLNLPCFLGSIVGTKSYGKAKDGHKKF